MKGGISVIVLAGGLGTRMRSSVPKVLYPLLGRPILRWVLECVRALGPEQVVVVTNPKTDRQIRAATEDMALVYAIQRRPLGTANAFATGIRALGGPEGPVLVLNGDTPLLRPETLRRFIGQAQKRSLSLGVLSFYCQAPQGYGRVIRDGTGRAIAIREEKDLSETERQIKEVNSGVYYMKTEAQALVRRIKKNPLKGEYYLTDIVGLALKRGLAFDVLQVGREEEFLGINTKEELLQAQRILRRRLVMGLVEADVFVLDEDRVYVGPDVRVGPESTIYPDVYLEGKTLIGSNCTLGPNVRIVNSRIGNGVQIREFSVLEDVVVEDWAMVGPFARLRPGTVVKKGARIGNFVEVKNSSIGEGTKALHLSYIGDATVGKDVNIGAGTITCNYDGLKKHRTVIEDGAFIGSDTQLVAPVKVSRGAYIGAGTTVTRDVPPDSLAVSRSPQKNIPGWAKRKKKRE